MQVRSVTIKVFGKNMHLFLSEKQRICSKKTLTDNKKVLHLKTIQVHSSFGRGHISF